MFRPRLCVEEAARSHSREHQLLQLRPRSVQATDRKGSGPKKASSMRMMQAPFW